MSTLIVLHCLLCSRLLTFQVFRVLLTTGSWGCQGLPAISAVSNLIHDFEQTSGRQINRGKSALIPARQLSDDERASCLAIWNSDIRNFISRTRAWCVSLASMCPFTINTTMQFTSLIWHFLSLGRVKMSLSFAMRVPVVYIFMFTHFSRTQIDNFSCRVCCCKRSNGKFCVFLTPITWAKLGMLSAVGALYGTQLFLQDLRLSNVASVCCSLTKPGVPFAVVRSLHWDDGDDDTHFSPTLPSVGRLHSEIVSEAGHRRPKRLFRFLYQRLAGAELHRWETYLEHRVQAKGWDGPHIASYTTTPAQECAATSQMVPC